MANAYRDENSVPTLIAVSNVDGFTPVRLWADPVTHRLLVDATGGGFLGSQEKSTTTPNGVTTTFAFTHTPKMIVWNGAVQTLTDDYTVSSNNITFTASAGVPQTNDKIINIYA